MAAAVHPEQGDGAGLFTVNGFSVSIPSQRDIIAQLIPEPAFAPGAKQQEAEIFIPLQIVGYCAIPALGTHAQRPVHIDRNRRAFPDKYRNPVNGAGIINSMLLLGWDGIE